MRNSSIWIQYFRYKEYLTKLQSVTMALNSRSSRSQIFFKLGVLKNLEIFTGKYLCWNLSLFNEIAGLKAYNFIKKRLQHRCFPVNIAKFVRTYFIEHHTSGDCFWILFWHVNWTWGIIRKIGSFWRTKLKEIEIK